MESHRDTTQGQAFMVLSDTRCALITTLIVHNVSMSEAEEHVTTWGGRNKMDNLGLWISS